MSKTLVLKPRISEKAYALSQLRNTYVFDVPGTANRTEVAAAVEAQFGVSVEDVNIAIVKGKAKRMYRKGGRPVSGQRSDVKKAYVRLKDGESIPVFATADAEAAETPKPDKKEAKK